MKVVIAAATLIVTGFGLLAALPLVASGGSAGARTTPEQVIAPFARMEHVRDLAAQQMEDFSTVY